MIPFLSNSSSQKDSMNKKYVTWHIYLLVGTSCSLLTHYSTADQSMVQLDSPIIFNKETLQAQTKDLVYSPALKLRSTPTKAELKQLKKEFESITYKKDAKQLTDKELRQAADLAIKLGWFDKALLYLQQLITNSKDSELIKVVKLEIADLLFEMGKLAKAETAYAEFLELYPGCKHAEYAHYKNILCAFYQTLSPDRDQSPTRQTLALTETYLEKGLAYKQYRTEVAQIRQQCNLLLYENDVDIFNQYLKSKKYSSAAGRLAHIKLQHLSKLPSLEPNILTLECRLAQAQGDTQVYELKLAQLNKKYPHHGQTTRVAQNNTKKKDYAARF